MKAFSEGCRPTRQERLKKGEERLLNPVKFKEISRKSSLGSHLSGTDVTKVLPGKIYYKWMLQKLMIFGGVADCCEGNKRDWFETFQFQRRRQQQYKKVIKEQSFCDIWLLLSTTDIFVHVDSKITQIHVIRCQRAMYLSRSTKALSLVAPCQLTLAKDLLGFGLLWCFTQFLSERKKFCAIGDGWSFQI